MSDMDDGAFPARMAKPHTGTPEARPKADFSGQAALRALRPWGSCPCCGGIRHRLDFDFSISINPLAVPGQVVTCQGCGLQFKIPSRPDVPLEAYYDDSTHYQHQDDVAEAMKEFKVILDIIRREAGPNATLLDIGAGAGHFLKSAVDAGFRAMGVELNADLARLASEHSGAEVIAGDAHTLPKLLEGREQSFMVVTLLDLIEHVRDPLKLLQDAAALLAPGGTLLVYTPNHRGLIVRTAIALHDLTHGKIQGPARGIYDCDHITFFDRASLREIARRAGLKPASETMVKFNPFRRGVAKGTAATALRIIEAFSPWILGEFRILLTIKPAGIELG